MADHALTPRASPRMAVWKAALATLPIALLSASGLMRLIMAGYGQVQGLVAGLATWAVLTVCFFLMLRTGKTDRYRSVLFIALAVALPLYLIPSLFQAYGTNVLTDEATFSGKAQFCPLTIPMVILPAIVKRVVIFPGAIVAGATWFLLWAATSLALGRGWCSWGCFFGGWDELFSRLRRRPVIGHVDRTWRFAPYAVLLAIVLLSAATFTPIYCEWLCPFKTVSEFETPGTLKGLVSMVVFLALFAGLVVVLPLLTRKRVQCALFCPFGALQSFFNRINIFEVRVDASKCTECNRCIRECPTFSLDDRTLKTGKALMSCSKCGRCVDACTEGAISFHIKGTPLGVRPGTARLLYLYPAFVLLAVLGGGIIAVALWRILNWVTTGSMI